MDKLLFLLYSVSPERGRQDVSLPGEADRGRVFPPDRWPEVYGDGGEAARLDLHHAVDGSEGGTGEGLHLYHSVTTTPVLDLHLREIIKY